MTPTTNTTSLPETRAEAAAILAKAKEIYRVPAVSDEPAFEPSTFKLQDKVVLLILTMHAPGNDRRIKDKTILDPKTDVDHKRIAVSKTLIEAKEFKAISIHDSRIRSYVQSVALPSPFKSGVYAVPITMLSELDQKLQELTDERAALVDAYAKVYSAAKGRAKVSLGSEYRESDYLDVADLPRAYRMEWQFVSLTAPDQIAQLDAKVYRREQERLAKQWEEAVTEMRDALRVGLSEMVTDMVGRLEGAGEGKRFKPTKILQRFEEFLGNVTARNVTDDKELAELAAQAKAVLAGVTTEELTKKSDVRAAVQNGLAAVKVQLDQLEITSKGRRKISLD